MKCQLNKKIKLNRFFDKNFFDNAFEDAYTITEDTNNAPEATESVSNEEPNVEVVEEAKTVTEPSNYEIDGIGEVSKEQIKEWYEKANKKEEPRVEEITEREYSQEVKDALELYKYLENNPHLIQSLQNGNQQAYQEMRNLVPDETMKRLQELEEYVENQRYESYVNGLKTKYSDFNEDAVLEYAQEHDVLDLEVAYKAMKADKTKEPNMDELRAQIRQEIMEELKNNSLQTQSIISSSDQTNSVKEEVQLSAQEMRVARGLGMSPSEYAKWAK